MHNNNHVILFYDPPHLLKNVCNNLKRLSFKVGENNVLRQHTVSFYCNTKTCGFFSVFRESERVYTGTTMVPLNSILPSDRSYFVVVVILLTFYGVRNVHENVNSYI
jgi:hypothetical protein